MARRGFFAELQHQQRLAEQRQRREQSAAVRAHNRAVREAHAAQQRAERAHAQAIRASEKERKQAEREAKALYKEQMIALAAAETASYEGIYDEIDNILLATLDVDDYVDLDSLKVTVDHPRFDAGETGKYTPEPEWIPYPPEPRYVEPPAPSGLGKLFGGAKRHQEAVARARAGWTNDHAHWQQAVTVDIPAENNRLHEQHEKVERARKAKLRKLEAQYDAECERRENEAAEHNASVDDLVNRLGQREDEAINAYIGIVLANSVYPEHFLVEYDYSFDGELRELSLVVEVPEPEAIPSIKQIKYVATADELRETPLSKTAQKARYNNAVFATALRSFHEVFEADRTGYIESISLTVCTPTADPATGHRIKLPFVFAAAAREQFMDLNLANVEPASALRGLRSTLSKNPFERVAAPEANTEVRG